MIQTCYNKNYNTMLALMMRMTDLLDGWLTAEHCTNNGEKHF